MPERNRPHPLVELFGEFPDRLRGDRWQPAADVFETRDEVVVRFELAGVRGDELRVHLEGDRLKLRGVRRVPSDGNIDKLHQMEISFGPFEREIAIDGNIDPDGVRARLEDGLLVVRIRKATSVARRVEVRAE